MRALSLLLLGSLLTPPGVHAQSTRRGDKTPTTKVQAGAAQAGTRSRDTHLVKIGYISATWEKVLKDLAENTDSTLVAQHVPTGRFSRRDRNQYTRTEAVRVFNRELELKGFRILEQGEFLVLIRVEATRQRYERPLVPQPAKPSVRPTSPPKPQTTAEELTPFESQTDRESRRTTAEPDHGTDDVRRVSHAAAAAQSVRSQPVRTQAKTIIPVRARNTSAVDLSRTIYEAYKSNAELVSAGPQGLPAFRVFRPAKPVAVAQEAGEPARLAPQEPVSQLQFTIGINTPGNELVIEAGHAQAQAVAKLVQTLDVTAPAAGDAVQFVPSGYDVRAIARDLRPAVKHMLAQGNPQDPFADQPAQQPDQQTQAIIPGAVGDNQPPISGLKGDVSIEEIPGVGLVVKGNAEDVEKVMEVIRNIEELATGAAPTVRVHHLKHVQSTALSELLNNVYEQLSTARGRLVQQTQNVRVVPIVKPNAILILASAGDLTHIVALIEELDQPVDPETEFMVFSLKNAIASQVVTMLDTFYQTNQQQQQGGLAARVRAVSDSRTNTVVVQASPRDMKEVAALIEKMDRDNAGSVSQVQFFPLSNAIATELVDVVNQAIQSVVNPPTTPQGQGGQFGGAGGGIGQSQQLREAKSAILQFLTEDHGKQRVVRSGILADIRITADARTNSLVVTAPEQSMELMGELIKRFDRPAMAISVIKHFSLANADATSVSTLLQELLVQQAQQGQNQLGIQLAGAEDASSALIPLKLSVDIRTNSIIAIGSADTLRVVEVIILRLDQGNISDRRNRVFKLKNSPATDVSLAINDFLASQRNLQQADPNLVSAYEQIQREVIVVPEPVSNSLLISATPRYFEDISELVLKLDAAPPQVIIQALLVEVTLDNTDEFGIELGIQDSTFFRRSIIDNLLTISETTTLPTGAQTTTQRIISQEATPGFNFNNNPLGTNPSLNSQSLAGQALSNFATGRVNGDLGFGGLVLSAGNDSLSFLLRALAQCRRVEILSRPQIRTLDNQLAQIQVGQRVPIVDGVNVNATTGAVNPLIVQDEAGIILTVTPRISPDGMIVMEVVAEKSQYTGAGVPIYTDAATGSVVESPIKDLSTARATVAVANAQTIVLGGMITKLDDTEERKVPWLGDIPILGNAFRYDYHNTRRTELLIFLTPRIIRDDTDSEIIKQVEAQRLHFTEWQAEEIHGPIYAVPPESDFGQFEDDDYPSMPPAPGEEDVPTTLMNDSSSMLEVPPMDDDIYFQPVSTPTQAAKPKKASRFPSLFKRK